MAKSIKEWEKDVASVRRGLSARILKAGLKYFSSAPKSTQPVYPSFTNEAGVVM